MQNLYRPRNLRRGIWRSLLDHKFTIGLVWLLCVGGALVYTSFSQRRYVSEAKVFIRLGRESVKLDPTATTGQTLAVQESRDGEINSVFELFGSRVVLASVVDELGENRILNLDPPSATNGNPAIVTASLKTLNNVNLNPFHVYSHRDEAIEQLQRDVKIRRPHKTHLLVLEYESHDPKLSKDVLGSLINAGREAHLRVHVAPGSEAFFEKQADLFAKELVQLEDGLNELKNAQGIADLAQQRQLHMSRIGALEEDRARAQASLESTLAELAQRHSVLNDIPESVVLEQTEGMPAVPEDRMRERLYELEIREKELLSRFQPDHFLVHQVQAQLAMARETLELQEDKLQTTRGQNDTRKVMELNLFERRAVAAGLKAQIASLSDQIAADKAEVERLNETQLAIARQERMIAIASENYITYTAKLEQARIDSALEGENYSNLSLLQPPSYSVTPTRPVMLLNLGLGMLLATLGSLGIVLLSEESVPIDVDAPTKPEDATLDGPTAEIPPPRRTAIAPGHPR